MPREYAFQCSSASRKFLNSRRCLRRCLALPRFSALQRAENSSIRRSTPQSLCPPGVSVLFSEPKIPQFSSVVCPLARSCVSVLFSEPKIPQLVNPTCTSLRLPCFSALQRAENSSIQWKKRQHTIRNGFSALQRAENSSIFHAGESGDRHTRRFSALQRAENSSILLMRFGDCNEHRVSVLFSEPKIPQFPNTSPLFLSDCGFSALQRAENSSMRCCGWCHVSCVAVSVLFSEPKIPQLSTALRRLGVQTVSVLFSEPKIPQSPLLTLRRRCVAVSVLFSEPKIPQFICSA